MSKQNTYECAVTGEIKEAAFAPQGDGLEGLPESWTEITIKRRVYNPQWISIQQVKNAALQSMMQGIPQELQEQQAWMLQLQIDAQFATLEDRYPMYLTLEDTVYVSNADDAKDAIDEIRDILDLDPVEDEGDDESEEDDEDEEEEGIEEDDGTVEED